MSIKWNKSEMARLDRAISTSLEEFGKELIREINEKQVVPKKTGALEKSQVTKPISKDTIRLTYEDIPYATRLYYHPEYNFNREINANAQGEWLEPIFHEDSLISRYAKLVRKKV